MKNSLVHQIIVFLVFIFLCVVVVNIHAQTARILVVGDDWAEKILKVMSGEVC